MITHIVIIALVALIFYTLLPRRKKEKHKKMAQSTYYEILQNIEEANYPGDFFWIEQQINNFESYFMELIDRDTHIRYYNDMKLKAERKERKLLTSLGMKQFN